MSYSWKHQHAWLGGVLAILGVLDGGRSTLLAEESLPAYHKVSGLEGSLSSIGSDSLKNLMTHWGEAFRQLYPNVTIQIEGKGSATVPPGISQGVAQLGPISRKMKPEEEQVFEKKRGFKPTCLSVAVDCVAVYVHKDNPLQGLTMAQVDGIFSTTQNSGIPDLVTWGDAGLAGPLAKLPISIYGRNSDSGTYAYFRQQALLQGEYKDTVREEESSAAVVQGVATDPAGIGYASLGYRTSDVRALPLGKTLKAPLAEASIENAVAGSYPLGRTLHIYVAKRPQQPLPKLNEEFLKFVLSKDGQEVVVKAGYGALPHSVVTKQLDLLK
ncbi:MAG: phosphate ABC transporter substrate-binding protein [Planctomycetota bacterium]|nr:phosphate ABC transporter substrate-binding protein [Planctomycetota bacterium]